MTATLAQTQADLPRLLEVVARGEDVLILVEGQPKARLTQAIVPAKPLTDAETQKWMDELEQLRAQLYTGKMTPTAEQLIEEDRSDHAQLADSLHGSIPDFMSQAELQRMRETP
jgi:antitoxin (DNA-binding transcriptional repressor) of toxin-antitoxin stability system